MNQTEAELPNLDQLRDTISQAQARRRLPPPEVRAALRREAGLSLRDAAHLLGVSATAVGFWETGHRTPARNHVGAYLRLLDELARAAGLTERTTTR
jgi:DNA-binding transcriptional regulator YiaG